MEQCLPNSESIFIYSCMSNQALSEEWEQKAHFQMCQILEATMACPSPSCGKKEREEGREARRQGLQEGRQAEEMARRDDSHTAAGQREQDWPPGSTAPEK